MWSGSVPPVGVDARSGTDIQAAVNFARKHNLKLVVKSTGHDFLGRSTARSFLIWTHRMKDMSYTSTFIPEGAPVTSGNTFNGNFILFFLFAFSVTYQICQLSLMELVFNSMKHTILFGDKDGPLLEV